MMISKSAATRFLLAISESIGTLYADESTRRPWKALSLMVSESAATQLSVKFFKSTGTLCADESKLQLERQSR
jgi:hypothetical protein